MYSNYILFPLAKNGKIPIIDKWQFLNSTPYEKFKKDCNVGILCGKANNIICVDVDIKNFKEEALKFIEDFDLMNTSNYIIKTWSGGYHFYYEYDGVFSSTFHPVIDDKKYVDIISNNAYCVLEGSTVNNIQYEIVKGFIEDVKPMITQNKNLYNYLQTLKTDKKQKVKIVEGNINNLDFSTKQITDEQYLKLEKILFDKEFVKYNVDYYKYWLSIISVLKVYNLYELMDKWSKFGDPHTYDKKNNLSIWSKLKPQKIKLNLAYIEFLYNKLYDKDFTNVFKIHSRYTKITEVPKNELNISLEYLTNKDRSINISVAETLKENKITIIKSNMGSGKTTMMNTFLNDNKNLNLVSVVSRRSLANAQYKLFNASGKRKVLNYLTATSEELLTQSMNIIIQLESLQQIVEKRNRCMFFRRKDLTEDIEDPFILYLDEFSSLLRHLSTSPTLKKKRKYALNVLIQLIYASTKVIITDADINDSVFKFFELLNLDFKFINNQYKPETKIKHYKCVSENSQTILKHIIDKGERAVFCSDSKVQCDIAKDFLIKNKVDETDILIITSTETENNNIETLFDTDKWEDYKVIIYSPSVVYGVDFVPKMHKYNVVVDINQCSVSPLEIGQMIFRCRNISDIYTVYTNGLRGSKFCNLYTIKQAEEYYFNMYNEKSELDSVLNPYYFDVDDCENINNYLFYYHFLQEQITKSDYEYYINECITTKGILTFNFKDDIKDKLTKAEKKEIKKEVESNNKEYEQQKFNEIHNLMLKEVDKKIIKKNDAYKSQVDKIDYLKLDVKNMVTYSEVVTDKYEFNKHYVASQIIDIVENGGQRLEQVYKNSLNNDFKLNVDDSILGKLNMLNDVKNLTCEETRKSKAKKLSDLTRIVFNGDVEKFFYKVSNSLIGDNLFTQARKKVNGKDKRWYVFNEELYKFHKDLLSLRRKDGDN